MIRDFNCKKYIITVVKLVILIGMSDRIAARNLPSKQAQTGQEFYTDINTVDFTYDTNKVLPEGSEVKAYLLVNETIK